MVKKARKTARRGAAPTTEAKRFSQADAVERIRLALPIAREIVTAGLQAIQTQAGDDNVTLRTEQLLGFSSDPDTPDDSPAMHRVFLHFDAAFSIGVAVGLMMRSEVFETPAVQR